MSPSIVELMSELLHGADDRHDPGTSGDHQDVPALTGRGDVPALWRSEAEHVAALGAPHQGAAHPAGLFSFHMELEDVVVAWPIRDRVRPPHPVTPRRHQRTVL